MSKMGQEFEKNLDNAKYDLYVLLKTVTRFIKDYRWHEHLWDDEENCIICINIKKAKQAIAKVEGLDNKD